MAGTSLEKKLRMAPGQRMVILGEKEATPTEETVAQIPTPKPSQELPTPVATPAME